MAEPSYIADDRICFGDLEIILLTGAESKHFAKRDDLYYMAKSRPYIEGYKAIQTLLGGTARNILEVGVFRGGSAAFLHRFFNATRVACVDIVQDVVPLNRYANETNSVLRLNYGIDQSDKALLRRIAKSNFDGQIDLASKLFRYGKCIFDKCANIVALHTHGVRNIENEIISCLFDAVADGVKIEI